MEFSSPIESEEPISVTLHLSAFTGRSDILDEIKQDLLKGQHVCLNGDRGIGKTQRQSLAELAW